MNFHRVFSYSSLLLILLLSGSRSLSSSSLSPLRGMTSSETIAQNWAKRWCDGNEISNSIKPEEAATVRTLLAGDDCSTKAVELAQLTRLEAGETFHPDLWDGYVHHEIVESLPPLGDLPNLEEIYLPYAEPDNLAPLVTLPRLRKVELPGASISDLGPLADCEHLIQLNLQGLKADDLAPLHGLSTLEELNLRNWHPKGLPGAEVASALSALIRSLPRLKSLTLNAQGMGTVDFLRDAGALETLSLSKPWNVDLSPLIEHPSLRELEILDLGSGLPGNSFRLRELGNCQLLPSRYCSHGDTAQSEKSRCSVQRFA